MVQKCPSRIMNKNIFLLTYALSNLNQDQSGTTDVSSLMVWNPSVMAKYHKMLKTEAVCEDKFQNKKN